MKIVFFGTPYYVLPVLESLHKSFRTGNESPIAAVVTQKPSPSGRNQQLSFSAVDDWAHKRNIPKFYNCEELLASGIKADIGVLASFAQIIPIEVLKLFPYGIINIHPSLLPKFRGSSPVQATIITGEEAGCSFIKLDEKLDHGQIISQFKDEVLDNIQI